MEDIEARLAVLEQAKEIKAMNHFSPLLKRLSRLEPIPEELSL